MNMMKFNEITFEFTTIDPYKEVVNEEPLGKETRHCINQEFEYNYNLHIMEERYNILHFSNGIVNYLFPN